MELYENDPSRIAEYGSEADRHVRCEKLTAREYGWKNAWLWNLTTLGKVKVYAVYDGEKRIHTSYVVRGNEKFRFLRKKDIEIGPCWTHTEYRGRGIYPAVLRFIVKEELADAGMAYMLIRETNEASQRGAAKAGFRKTGDKVKKDAFQLSTPSFMNKKLPADNNGIGSGKVFAIPAFKITDGQEK